MNDHHRINYVEFFSKDIEATKDFYSRAFGWNFTDYGPEYVAFNDGHMDGGFAKGPVDPGGNALIVLYSSNLEESLQTVEANGGVICKPIFNFPGGRRFHFRDPTGNELAIWSDK